MDEQGVFAKHVKTAAIIAGESMLQSIYLVAGIVTACNRTWRQSGQTAQAGAHILNYSRSAKEAEATADECRALGAQVQVVQADVGEDADCRKLRTLRQLGRLDVLVNNAGITKKSRSRRSGRPQQR